MVYFNKPFNLSQTVINQVVLANADNNYKLYNDKVIILVLISNSSNKNNKRSCTTLTIAIIKILIKRKTH